MSVLIKGLNIKPCKDGFDGKGLVIIGYDDKLYAVAHEQIIPLPDHGDLIDRDEYRRAAGMAVKCEECSRKQYAALFICPVARECGEIDRAPAVIPAERSKE